MTPKLVTSLMRAAIEGTPHEPGAIEQAEWYIRYMDRATLKEAANCYAAIVGERTLPAHIGPKHAQEVLTKPLAGREQHKRAAAARAILEDRRNAE
jgi:hypothetical protein